MTAAQKVFSITELLENVLIHLPLQDLFAFQRINSTFRSTIEDSKDLRQAMCLEIPATTSSKKPSAGLFSDKMPRERTFGSPRLERAIRPLRVISQRITQGHVVFKCSFSGPWRMTSDINPEESWRNIKLSYRDLPVKVMSPKWPHIVYFLPSTATLGDLTDELPRQWDKAIDRWEKDREHIYLDLW